MYIYIYIYVHIYAIHLSTINRTFFPAALQLCAIQGICVVCLSAPSAPKQWIGDHQEVQPVNHYNTQWVLTVMIHITDVKNAPGITLESFMQNINLPS